MRTFLILIFLLAFNLLKAQSNDGVTNITLIPHDFTEDQMQVMEDVFETMVKHEGFIDMKRSMGVYTPIGPSNDYKEVIEIHFKSMELMSDWRDKMEEEIPQERRSILGGSVILFYMYR